TQTKSWFPPLLLLHQRFGTRTYRFQVGRYAEHPLAVNDLRRSGSRLETLHEKAVGAEHQKAAPDPGQDRAGNLDRDQRPDHRPHHSPPPIQTAGVSRTLPSRMCVIPPTIAVGTIATSEVPCATACEMRKPTVMVGTKSR